MSSRIVQDFFQLGDARGFLSSGTKRQHQSSAVSTVFGVVAKRIRTLACRISKKDFAAAKTLLKGLESRTCLLLQHWGCIAGALRSSVAALESYGLEAVTTLQCLPCVRQLEEPGLRSCLSE